MKDSVTTPKVTVERLAATIIEAIGQGQSDSWWYANTPKVEELLNKYVPLIREHQFKCTGCGEVNHVGTV